MRRLVPSAALALAIGAVVATLSLTGLLVTADDAVYDQIVTRMPPPSDMPEVVIVAIDDPSFADVGLPWPWPRSLHGALIRSLRAAGARRIGYDVVFAEHGNPEEDAALADSLGTDVILASYDTVIDTDQGLMRITVSPFADLAQRAMVGGIDLPVDADGAIRRLAEDSSAMATQLAATAAPPGARIRYATEGIRTVSFYQALNAAEMLPPDTFRDKVALVGISLEASPATAADAFRVPATAVGEGFMAGVTIHGHAYRTLAAGAWITPLPAAIPALLALVFAGLSAAATAARPAGSAAVTTAALAALPLAGAGLGIVWGAWIPPIAPMLAALLAGAGQVGLDYTRERRARRQVLLSFGQYLAPELVRRLTENPELLKLGGERREISILFCDLRGFTTLSERMRDDPVALTSILNQAMDILARAVVDNGGMVDKFIGDCVMALWNAPADDPGHPEHAVAAGRAMISGVAALNTQLARDGHAVTLACGVGINTGECTVGNMGSALRFDYTAIGDPVNLASRLESLTKEFGTPMLLGFETARRLTETKVIELGRTPIKGRQQDEAVFAPEDLAPATATR